MKIENENKYSEDYNEDGFWEKIKNFAKDAGKEVIEKALQLYYVLDKKDVPMAIKTIIWGALAYLFLLLMLFLMFYLLLDILMIWVFWLLLLWLYLSILMKGLRKKLGRSWKSGLGRI